MNRSRVRGVLLGGKDMDALGAELAVHAVSGESFLSRELDTHLKDGVHLAFRVAMGVLHNRADAEDVTQDALLRACRGFRRLRDAGSFRAWLVRITWRLALDRIRSAGRRERREQAVGEATPISNSPEQIAAAREFQSRLSRGLDSLPERLRLVLVLSAIEGYDMREVAALLHIPEGTVKSRLFQARKRLMEQLQWPANKFEKR